MWLLQNSHPDRPRPGRRLGGLTNLFSSRHRNSFSPNSGREELQEENVSESSKAASSSKLNAKPVSKSAHVENIGSAEVTTLDTGSGTAKTTNSRVPNSQNRFSRNLSNSETEAISDANVAERDLASENEKSKRIPSLKQGSKTAISEPKRTGLLRRDKEKRGLLVRQGSEDSEKSNPQHDRLRSAPSSDSEMVVHRSNRSRKEEKKKLEGRKYLDAMSLR